MAATGAIYGADFGFLVTHGWQVPNRVSRSVCSKDWPKAEVEILRLTCSAGKIWCKALLTELCPGILKECV